MGHHENEQIRNLLDEQFRRLTGVKRQTFEKMLKKLIEDDKNKKSKEAARINYQWKTNS